MKRRELILACSALGALAAARASAQAKAPRLVGWLSPGTLDRDRPTIEAFTGQMKTLGYVEGRDYVIERRQSEGRVERLPALAKEIAAAKPAVIVTASSGAIAALKKETSVVPIVFTSAADVVEQGFVASLARPGGNITGVTLRTEVFAKLVQLVRETQPPANRLALLVHEGDPSVTKIADDFRRFTSAQDFQMTVFSVRQPEDFARTFAEMVRAKTEVVVAPQLVMLIIHESTVAGLAMKSRLPIYSSWRAVRDGVLLNHYSEITENHRRVAVMVDKIFKGTKPADIPVEEPDRFSLVINLRTAKALGITIPQSVLIRADEVIR